MTDRCPNCHGDGAVDDPNHPLGDMLCPRCSWPRVERLEKGLRDLRQMLHECVEVVDFAVKQLLKEAE